MNGHFVEICKGALCDKPRLLAGGQIYQVRETIGKGGGVVGESLHFQRPQRLWTTPGLSEDSMIHGWQENKNKL